MHLSAFISNSFQKEKWIPLSMESNYKKLLKQEKKAMKVNYENFFDEIKKEAEKNKWNSKFFANELMTIKNLIL